MSVKEKMTAIADNIRNKTEKTEKLNLDTISSGVNEVHEAGKKKGEFDFWDKFPLDNVGAMSFSGNMWTEVTFQPPQDIIFGSSNGNWTFSGNKINNVKTALAINGVKMDTHKLTGCGYAFRDLSTIELPEIDLSGIKSTSSMGYGICNNQNLITIDKIVLPTNWTTVTNFTGFLAGNPKLQNIIIEGIIPCSLNISASPLTVESMMSIITHLKDYAGTANVGSYTLTLKDSCKTLMAQQGVMDELGGKTYDAYIADIGWNLA